MINLNRRKKSTDKRSLFVCYFFYTIKNLSKLHLALFFIFILSCQHGPDRAKSIKTHMKKATPIGGDEKVGIKDGKFIVQKKIMINEELRRTQNEVYSMEDNLYGSRKYGSQGLYGKLKACKLKLVSQAYGGDGKLTWTEPINRVTEKEETWDIGLDEEDKIVAISEEFLQNRIKRFKNYKRILLKREDEYKEKIEICEAKLKSQLFDLKKKRTKQNKQSQNL